ncbi:glycerol-3-phosphate dehydrogenase (NAD(P)+) [Bathymodiolus platifrons methanotrophic gill symbiont]|uniref:NAD(P)H-dependent glycerol-3-phosphate dehydrogenase n=1 Tax=Bathymodiolus platifrons methanotrophic gill symbiont TaxID=113268 RepID=UPI0011C771BB|nr:NAD(P)H-dependent glycerol-3-phosphate dehydrogenase [Bathymodiolus platifrons methanotrophic gill symbiont]TXK97614.1 glycerol-3-phosphate dehydrogenase [Methylococcaceae bacterium HT1]TXL16570.1 glycerol-3-phosphate dehydrogenase [Methylococcaceae bacterium HT3]TXL21639.1 glycerol-3-phosphate dehydrogenase [Methylococcaceae bacterium HT2]GFO74183.1 glycerol-3-phosphate dehydrogenase (NAD(P)+) [Bathymodiolus platifrons methanotrophic gill symbiont]
MTSKISVFGAGSWGTALAIQAAKNGNQTLLWGHLPEHIANLAKDRQNKRYLANLPFPDTLQVTDNLKEAAQFSDILLISVPSHVFQETLLKIKPFVNDQVKIAWASKGFNPETGELLNKIVANVFSTETPAAVLSGPSFAQEVAAGLPSAVTIAATQQSFADQLAQIMHSPRFRIYTTNDIISVQVGGAVKNVLAIAAGIADGIGFGANTRAALVTRGIAEIIRLNTALGGQQETLMGLAGLGDLILTCTDNQSRNRRFGIALGQGKNREQAIQEIGQEVEGISAAKETYMLAKKHGIDMPITEQTYLVLYEGLAPLSAVQNLLQRDQKSETL